MIRAFHTSAAGMNAQQAILDNTANNLANANTTGFKSSIMEFQDMLYTTLRQPGADATQNQQLPTGVQIGNGVKLGSNTRLYTAGSLDNTGNNLDVAIEGNGFFQIAQADGTFRYTRDGSFRLNANYQLVTADGLSVQPQLTFPQDAVSITIGTDGTVSCTTASSPSTATNIGQIQIARFANPAGLSSEGTNLFSETPASGTVTLTVPGQNGTGVLRGGYLEHSNVQVVLELVNLIQAQRAYEFNSKAIQVADEMLSSTNDLVR